MTAAILAGAGLGCGLLLLAVGLWPARPDPLTTLTRLDAAAAWRPAIRPTFPVAGSSRWVTAVVGGRVAAALAARGWLRPGLGADLRVLDLDPAEFAAAKLGWTLAGLLTPVLLTGVARLAGITVPLLVPAWLGLGCALTGFYLPDVQVRTRAGQARRGLRTAVGAYLDLVAMRMASGAGLAEALTDAARLGRGDAFARIRGALSDARTDGLSPPAALGRLGDELALPELVDTAARLALVEGGGAQAEASLRAQAASLRDRELSDLHGRANEATQAMLVAQVVLALGFLLFLGYPAVAKLLSF
ncbi:MAG TPA: hypothetical protein VNG13_10415 [Mycobacteriales bacterium]|nr:hypothetical protein [Mycobacteriales bacterium]